MDARRSVSARSRAERAKRKRARAKPPGKAVVVVGAGGNIGSHLVPHLARMNEVRSVTLIDRDVYESRNIHSQDITPRALGRPKATVQARRLGGINPNLNIRAVVSAVEDVPLGWLRGDVALACLDSREARRCVNEAAWRLGVPWIDAGVQPDGWLARITVFMPGAEGPCLECSWSDDDYALLEQQYPCGGGPVQAPATNGPSSLGALAAAFQAIECQKLLAGRHDQVAVGTELIIDARHQKFYLTRSERNPRCRFDHETWVITNLKRKRLTIHQALELAGEPRGGDGSPALWVEGQAFVRELACATCRVACKVFRFERRLHNKDRTCAKCGGKMVPSGLSFMDHINAEVLPKSLADRSLASLGLQRSDVFSVGVPGSVCQHFELRD